MASLSHNWLTYKNVDLSIFQTVSDYSHTIVLERIEKIKPIDSWLIDFHGHLLTQTARRKLELTNGHATACAFIYNFDFNNFRVICFNNYIELNSGCKRANAGP
jgi:hypothetical protein